ncbi:MAG TPA: agmatine deiminase family protein [Tepidisphaeraceae bacterium]|nr:agmatine deiminase family protein [Tepidisphaeraceae bacterium]
MDVGWVSASPPGDFEPHAAIILSLTEMLEVSPRTVVELVRALADRVPLVLIVRGEAQRQQAIVLLSDWGLPAHRFHFLFMPVGTWTRDFAPGFVRWSDGRVIILDARSPFPDRPNDDVVPAALAALLRVPRRSVPMVLEGGNLLSNGQGLALTTTALLDVNRFAGFDYDHVRVSALLAEYYGFANVAYLEPLLGYRTLHVDMFATFAGPDTVVVGACDPGEDAGSAAVLDRNAARLARLLTRSGPLRLVRVPMPPYSGGVCRTYTNVLYANGRLLVPHYPEVDGGLEREVLDVYAAVLPGWEIVRVDCSDVIRCGGALRCVSAHVPWLHERFAEAPASRPTDLMPTVESHVGSFPHDAGPVVAR